MVVEPLVTPAVAAAASPTEEETNEKEDDVKAEPVAGEPMEETTHQSAGQEVVEVEVEVVNDQKSELES